MIIVDGLVLVDVVEVDVVGIVDVVEVVVVDVVLSGGAPWAPGST